MTYKELLIELTKHDSESDHNYTINHLTVEEIFSSELTEGKQWNDLADSDSLKELNQ